MTATTMQPLRSPAVMAGLATTFACVLGLAIVSGNYVLLAVPVGIPLLLLAFLQPILALSAMVMFVPLEGMASLIPGSFTLPRMLGFLAFACFGANYLVQRKHIQFDASARLFGFFILWIFASSFWAQSKAEAWTLNFVMFQLFLFYVMAQNLMDSPRELRFVLFFYIAGCTISSVMAIHNFMSGSYATRFLARVSSIEDMNPNDFGRMIGFGLLCGLWLLFDDLGRWMRGLVLLSFPINLIGLVLSKGRGAWLAFLLALVVVFVRIRKTARVWGAAMLVIALGVGTGVAGVQLGYFDDTLTERFDETVEGKDPTAQRLDIWKVGFALVRDNPVAGVGFNNFHVRFNDYLHEVRTEVFPGFNKDPHNIFLSVLGETGIVGFTMFVGLFWIILKWIRRAGKSWDGAIALAFIVFTVFAGMSGTDYIRKWFWISLVAALILARRQAHARTDH